MRRQLVTHHHPRVLVIRPRVDVLSHRCAFVLQGAEGTYGARAGLYPVSRLEQALRAAGFELEDHPTRFTALPRPPF